MCVQCIDNMSMCVQCIHNMSMYVECIHNMSMLCAVYSQHVHCVCSVFTCSLCVQCIHNMSMWTSRNKELSYDQAKEDAKKAQKDVRLVSQCATLTLLALKLHCLHGSPRLECFHIRVSLVFESFGETFVD